MDLSSGPASGKFGMKGMDSSESSEEEGDDDDEETLDQDAPIRSLNDRLSGIRAKKYNPNA